MNSSKCIICGSVVDSYAAEFAPFLIERMFGGEDAATSLSHCPKCGIFYSSKRPTDAQMSRLYSGYRGVEYQKQREKHEPFYTEAFNRGLGFSADVQSERKRIMMEVFSRHADAKKVKRLLDYGGDCGQYIPDEFSEAKRYVYEISGADPLDGIGRISDEAGLRSEKWDMVMCCHVLEHLSRPMEVVEQILDVMPPKAYLYLEVPYENCAVDGKVYIHEHINLFRPQTFFEIFTRKRLRILEYGVAELKTRDGRVFGRHIQCLVRKQRPGMFAVNSTLRRMLAKTAELCALDVQKSPDRICVKLRGRKIFSRTKRG